MRILIIGGGGREHALAWSISASPRCEQVYLAPGNGCLTSLAKAKCVGLIDSPSVLAFLEGEKIDLTIIGPEAFLVDGLVDKIREQGFRVFGPNQSAAQLEGSKAFAKDFMQRHLIPTASHATFSDLSEAADYLRERGAPIVIKADGLAAGKGVTVAQTLGEALAAVEDCLSGNKFGEAGHRVVIEDFLQGEEASFICMVDTRQNILPLATSQDHKARNNGDTGPNTGGMGAYSPAPVVTSKIHDRIMREIIEPTVQGLLAEGIPYTGFLYAGLMISPDGSPKVIEFNVRLGDPETQPIMMRLKSDLLELIEAALDGRLHELTIEWDPRPALGVVMATATYPEGSGKGAVIAGIDDANALEDVTVFHAGTRLADDGSIVSNGGRVLCVTALGGTVADAQSKAYAGVSKIRFENADWRTDIGYRAVEREKG